MGEMIQGCEAIENEIRNPVLYKYSPFLFRYYYALDIVNKFLEKEEANGSCAIWGAGNHTVLLWHGISRTNRKKIRYIIEKNRERHVDKDEMGVQYILPEEVNSFPIDSIIISSYIFKENIAQDIAKLGKNYRVMDIYKLLEEESLGISEDFSFGIGYRYNEITQDLLDLKNCVDLKYKRLILKKLIGEYLHIRDFCNAYKYIDELCSLEEEEREFYLSLKENVVRQFEYTNQKITGKQHVVVNWIDQIVAGDIKNMPFLNGLKSEGVFFENAYTVTPYTKPAMATIFSGGLYFDDKLYKMHRDDYRNAKLYKEMIDNGYDFKYFGGKLTDGIFYNPETAVYMQKTYVTYIPSTIFQWEALKEMEINDDKCFIIIHNLVETHHPYANGIQADLDYTFVNDTMRPDEGIGEFRSQKRKEQIVFSEKYLDIQLQFYMTHYKGIRANVFMSDHAQQRESKYNEFSYAILTHTILGIVGKNIKPRLIKDILSLNEFPHIIQCIFRDRTSSFEDYTREYALIQGEDVYDYGTIAYFFANPISARKGLIQYRGVVTLKDIYVHSILGEEYYYLQGNEQDNLIDVEEYQDRINKLREIAGNRFVNIYKEDKYIRSRKMYELLEFCVPEKTEYIN